MLPLAILLTLIAIGIMVTVKYMLVAYAMALKQTNTLWCVVLAALIFKEPSLKERLVGGIIILFGVLLICLSLF